MDKHNFKVFFLVAVVAACFIKNAHAGPQAQPEAIQAMQGLMGIEQTSEGSAAANINNVMVTVITGKQETVRSKKMWINPDHWGPTRIETIYDGGGTDCPLAITFCRDHEMNDCSKEFLLEAGYDVLEEGGTDTFNISRPDRLTSEYKYFRLTLKDSECGSSPQWHMQGIRVKIGGYTYYNPCVNKRFAPGDVLSFGPADTAACAIIETGDDDNSGTDDTVELVLKDSSTPYEISKTSLNLLAPSIEDGAGTDVFMLLSWGLPVDDKKSDTGYDDFEKLDVTSYGVYFFDSYPLSEQPEFFVKKAHDRRNGGWLVEGYEVFVFQPGQFLNSEGGAVFYKSGKPHAWIENESGLTYPRDGWIKLDEAGPEVIKDSIGGHL